MATDPRDLERKRAQAKAAGYTDAEIDAYLQRAEPQAPRKEARVPRMEGQLPAVTTTAKAPGAIERSIAQAAMQMGKTTPGMYAFGAEREQLTPAQRGSLERAQAGRAIAEDVGRAFGGQVERSVLRPVTGAATLLGARQAPALQRALGKLETETAPQTGIGAAARLASEIGAFIPGGIATSAVRTGLESAAGPEQSTANLALRTFGMPEIESPGMRALADVAIDLTPAAVLRGLGRGQPAARVGIPRAPQRPLAAPPKQQTQIRGLLPERATERPVPQAGPAIPTGGVTQRITEPSRLLPEAVPERSPFAEARLESMFAPRVRRIPAEQVPTSASPGEVRRYLQGEGLPAPTQKGKAPEISPATVRRPLTEATTKRATELELDRAAKEAEPRIREAELLDRYPDGTPRVTPQEVAAESYTRGKKAPKNLTDRELDLEYQRAVGRIEELEGARGRMDAAQQQAGGEILGATTRGRTKDMYTPEQWKRMQAAERKAYVASKRGQVEKLSIGERKQLGYDLTEDVRGMIEAAGFDSVEEFRQVERLARRAEFELPTLRKRFDALGGEYTKRGLSALPEELPPTRGAEPPASVLEELQGRMRQFVREESGAVAPGAAGQIGGTAAGAVAGAATTPEGEEDTLVSRTMLGGLAGAGLGAAARRLVRPAAEGAEAVARGADEAVAPGAFRGEVPLAPRAVPTGAAERAAERIKRPATPTPSTATYLPRTDDEWREFYGRFMTNPDEIAQADAMRQAGTVQVQQGTRPVAADKALAQTIGDTFGDLALRDAGRKLSGPELLALRAQREANAARRIALTERLADPELPPADREWMTSLRARLDDVMIQQFERYTRDVSQTGRDLRLLQEAVKMSDNPTDWVLRAERLAGGKPLNPQQEYELITAVKNKDLAKAAKVVGSLRETTLWDRAGEMWQTGLLTSFARPLRDVMSNVLNLTEKQGERAVATVVDRVIGTFTGVRTADQSLKQSLKLMNEGARKGGQAALAILRGKGDPETMARVMKRYDMERETIQKIPALQAYTTFIKRTIGAADALVYDAAVTTALGEQARVFARNVAKPGTEEFTQAVKRYLQAPPPEMLGIALSQAAEVTWQNSNVLGDLALSIRRFERPELRALGKLVVPFVQTPSAMTMQTLKGTPLATPWAAKDLYDVMRGTNVPAAQRSAVNRIAKMSVGSAWIALGYQLADEDKMTSWYPDDDRERRRWELEGRTESAVKVGGTWVSLLGVLGPQAQLMAVGAALRKMTDNPEWLQQTAVEQMIGGGKTILAGAGKALLDAPMMQGAKATMDIVQQMSRGEPEAIAEAGARAAQTFVGGAVPQGLQQIARATDITPEGTVRIRQPQVPGEPLQTALNTIMQGIPGLRQQVPVRRTALGEERATSVGGVAGVLSPARLSQETSDPVAQELWRTGAAIPRTPRREGESQADYDTRQQALGTAVRQVVEAVIQDPQYQAIATMDVGELRQALGQMMQSEGVPLPEVERLQTMSDEDVRRQLQGVILDRVIQEARTYVGKGFPDPRGGQAGSLLRGITRP